MKINHGFVSNEDGGYVITFKLTAPSPLWGSIIMAMSMAIVFGIVGLGIIAMARVIAGILP
jgi:hypothetical protein